MPIKLQILTIIHVILNSEGIVILYTNIIKSYSIYITTLTTLKWFAFTFLSDCTHITFYISKHTKQELSEVQKFFHERPLPIGKQPFVIRLHVHVHVLQRVTCHLFIHCQLNGTATEKGKKNQLLELWACLCENNNQLNKTAGTVQVTKTRVLWSQFLHNIDLFLDCLCVSRASDRSELTSNHSSQLAIAVYMLPRKNMFLLCSASPVVRGLHLCLDTLFMWSLLAYKSIRCLWGSK